MPPRRRATDDAAISRLVDQRREVLSRAVQVLDSDREVPIDVQPEALRETTALLATSLEELKVAEEELMQQNEELLITREAIEATSRHFRRMFEDAPLPYVVTDVCGIIRHANRAAATLLKRPAELLERKPLLTFVPLDRRGTFRDAISRLQLVDAARDWRVKLLRHGDEPVQVAIDVRLSPGARDGEDLICWMIRPTAAPLEAD
ncbi:MAG: PAS domain-containing protein [Gemmatimonadota bacterium]|nr:PAS domain-containing protein [Gemmatimonadota bacterium]